MGKNAGEEKLQKKKPSIKDGSQLRPEECMGKGSASFIRAVPLFEDDKEKVKSCLVKLLKANPMPPVEISEAAIDVYSTLIQEELSQKHILEWTAHIQQAEEWAEEGLGEEILASNAINHITLSTMRWLGTKILAKTTDEFLQRIVNEKPEAELVKAFEEGIYRLSKKLLKEEWFTPALIGNVYTFAKTLAISVVIEAIYHIKEEGRHAYLQRRWKQAEVEVVEGLQEEGIADLKEEAHIGERNYEAIKGLAIMAYIEGLSSTLWQLDTKLAIEAKLSFDRIWKLSDRYMEKLYDRIPYVLAISEAFINTWEHLKYDKRVKVVEEIKKGHRESGLLKDLWQEQENSSEKSLADVYVEYIKYLIDRFQTGTVGVKKQAVETLISLGDKKEIIEMVIVNMAKKGCIDEETKKEMLMFIQEEINKTHSGWYLKYILEKKLRF